MRDALTLFLQVVLSEMFADFKLNDLHEMSLTLMHDLEKITASAEYPIPPMEIKTFKATLS